MYFSVIVLSVYDYLAFADSREEKHCLFQRECEYRYIFITFIISKKSCTNPQINSITGFNSPKLSQRQQEAFLRILLLAASKAANIRGSILPLASVYLTNELNSCTFSLVVL